MLKNSLRLVLVLCLAATTATAWADPLHIKTPFTISSEGGTFVSVPAGYIISEKLWHQIDNRIVQQQQSLVRLKAENLSLAKSLNSAPHWGMVSALLLFGGLAGLYLGASF